MCPTQKWHERLQPEVKSRKSCLYSLSKENLLILPPSNPSNQESNTDRTQASNPQTHFKFHHWSPKCLFSILSKICMSTSIAFSCHVASGSLDLKSSLILPCLSQTRRFSRVHVSFCRMTSTWLSDHLWDQIQVLHSCQEFYRDGAEPFLVHHVRKPTAVSLTFNS